MRVKTFQKEKELGIGSAVTKSLEIVETPKKHLTIVEDKISKEKIKKLRIICLFFKDSKKDLNRLAEACLRFTPQVSVRENEAIFLEVSQCRRMYSEYGLMMRLSSLAKRFGENPQISLAEDVSSALAMARFQVEQVDYLPVDALCDYASPFCFDEELDKKTKKIISFLKVLGIESLKDFFLLPSGTLTSRFGAIGMKLVQRIEDSSQEPWPLYKKEKEIIESENLWENGDFYSLENLESIFFKVQSAVDRATARLRGLSLKASRVELSFEQGKNVPLGKRRRSWTLSLSLAQSSSLAIVPLLYEKVSLSLGKFPLEGSVESLSFRIIETVPGNSAQKNFFSFREEEMEEWDSLVLRLTRRVGEGNVFYKKPRESYSPEKFWTRISEYDLLLEEKNEDVHSERAKKPNRILKVPEPLMLVGDYFLKKNGNQVWRILQWGRPEAYSPEWWDLNHLEEDDRHYYPVQTEEGNWIWVFRTSQSPGNCFFLHGFFD
tara:strand:+ start:5855 stop:7330 length:1476 start_codon:yes stop_codon:yes gene_type:complete